MGGKFTKIYDSLCIFITNMLYTVYIRKKRKSILERRTKQMQITDIKVRKLFDEGPMKAIVSVTFDGQLAVHDIKVIYAKEKFFIVMPSRKNPDDTYRDIVHPINAQFRGMLESSVIAAYEAALEEAELEAARAEQAEGIPETV